MDSIVTSGTMSLTNPFAFKLLLLGYFITPVGMKLKSTAYYKKNWLFLAQTANSTNQSLGVSFWHTFMELNCVILSSLLVLSYLGSGWLGWVQCLGGNK